MSPLELDLPRVLLLDVHHVLSHERADILERCGATVHRVVDAREALECLLAHPYDLLWIGMARGERDGLLLLEELQREHVLKRLPSVVTVERPEPRMERQLHNLGVRRIFQNSCDPEVLGDAIFEEIEDARIPA